MKVNDQSISMDDAMSSQCGSKIGILRNKRDRQSDDSYDDESGEDEVDPDDIIVVDPSAQNPHSAAI